jgi:hypothetical protein
LIEPTASLGAFLDHLTANDVFAEFTIVVTEHDNAVAEEAAHVHQRPYQWRLPEAAPPANAQPISQTKKIITAKTQSR